MFGWVRTLVLPQSLRYRVSCLPSATAEVIRISSAIIVLLGISRRLITERADGEDVNGVPRVQHSHLLNAFGAARVEALVPVEVPFGLWFSLSC